jgi:hypothetical protein
MTEQIAAGSSTVRASLECLRGERVKVRAMNRGGSAVTRTGELRYIGLRNMIIALDSGRTYHVPLISIMSVEVLA